MTETAENVFESEDFAGVPPAMKERIQEAFNEAVRERAETMRPEIESAVRAELAERVGHDMDRIIESADRMITNGLQGNFEDNKAQFTEYADGLRDTVLADERKRAALSEVALEAVGKKEAELDSQLAEVSAERAKLMEDMRKFESLKAKYRKAAGAEMSRLQEVTERVVHTALKREVDELVEDRRQHRKVMKEQRERVEEFAANETARAVGRHNHAAELLEAERDVLEKNRGEVLSEARREFLDESTERVKRVIDRALSKNIGLLRGNIQEAQQNELGREMFEAFYGIYESRIANPNMQVADRDQTIEALQRKLDESKAEIEKRDKLIENTDRSLIILEMTSTLKGTQKDLMESYLENVRTEDLDKAFKKYLPKVLENSGSPNPAVGPSGTTGMAQVGGIAASGPYAQPSQNDRIRIAESRNHAAGGGNPVHGLSVKNGDRREPLMENSQAMFGPNAGGVNGVQTDDMSQFAYLVGRVKEDGERAANGKGD